MTRGFELTLENLRFLMEKSSIEEYEELVWL